MYKLTPKQIMSKYPRITAHLIAESLGYFTPTSAANAIIRAKNKEAYFCEWYSHCAMLHGDSSKENVAKVTQDQLKNAIRNRHYHTGYMASYKQARRIVDQALVNNEPIFASWF